MTIQQIFEKHSNFTALEEGNYGYMMDEEDFTNAAKELIEYHVKAALLQASEQITDGYVHFQYGDKILNSYPLTLIK